MPSAGRDPASDGPRVVLDTNVAVSALLFADGRLSWLRTAWQSGRFRPLVSKPVAEELIRVLAYPEFRLEDADRESLLGEYLPWCEVVRFRSVAGLPHCRDAADQMFLALALAAKADYLVTGDADLLALAREFRVPIVTPDRFRQVQLRPPGVAEKRAAKPRRKRTT